MQSEPRHVPTHSAFAAIPADLGQSLVLTGAAGRLGGRVLAALEQHDDARATPPFASVVAIDHDVSAIQRRVPSRPTDPTITHVASDLRIDDLTDLLRGCTVLVHLASAFAADGSHDDVGMAGRVFSAAGEMGVRHLVVVSSASVYGAWPDNPVPITEARDPKPNPGFEFAASKLELERAAHTWRAGAPGRTVTVLRPVITPSPTGTSGWLDRAVRPSRVDLFLATPPPVQYVHVDDVASAVVHAATHHLDGTFNVSPDRWLRGEDAPPLMGMPVTVPATGPVREVASAVVRVVIRPLLSLAPRPSGSLALSRHPWVVANDRLKATGWHPLSTTEEVLVAQRRPSRISKLFARKRQEVTMAALGAAGLSTAGLLSAALRRAARTRR